MSGSILPIWAVILLGLVLLVGVGGLAYLILREQRRLEQDVERAELVANEIVDHDDNAVEPPDIGGSLKGLLTTWRHQSKAKRMARKGYIRWYKLGATLSKPKWIKPKTRGAGVPEYQDSDDGVTYLFPEDELVQDQATGAYTCIHKHNEPEPVPIKDPALPRIDGDRLEEIINLEAESDAPGFFDGLNIDPKTAMWAMIVLVLLFAGAQQVMG